MSVDSLLLTLLGATLAGLQMLALYVLRDMRTELRELRVRVDAIELDLYSRSSGTIGPRRKLTEGNS